MRALRDPESGCPWDQKQDFLSITPYTIEEAYEVADAIERGDMHDLKDELGDLTGQERAIARLALLLAKSSYQIDEAVVREVLDAGDQKRFIRILAWCTFTASRYLANRIAKHTNILSARPRQAA